MESCGKCCQVVTPDEITVTCAGRCKETFHVACVNLSSAVANALTSNSGWSLICAGCRLELPTGGKKRKVATVQTPVPDLSPQLPTEIWAQIFEKLSTWQLPRVRLVCRRWRDIVDGAPSVIVKFTVTFSDLLIDRGYCPDNLLRVPKVRFGGVRIVTVGSWWAPFGNGLTELELNDCKIMLPHLLAMLRHTANLRCLQLKSTIVDMLGINPQADFRLEKLEKLAICGIFRAENLELFGEICPNVRHLKLVNDGLDRSDNCFDRFKVAFVGVRHSTLEHLEIDCDDGILIGLMKFKQWKLKELVLGVYENEVEVENVGLLIDFCRMLPGLETLHVEGAVSIVTAFNGIEQLLPKLTNLMLMPQGTLQIQPTFLTQIAHLRYLQLSSLSSDCLPVDFTGIECPQLKLLILERISISDRSLEQFLAKSLNLRSLSLYYCKLNYWSNIFRSIGCCKRLQSLSLIHLSAIDCNRCFIEYLDDMRHLTVVGCNMPQEMLSTLLCLCPRLEVLYLVSLKDVLNNEVLSILCGKLNNLVRVKIKECAQRRRSKTSSARIVTFWKH